MPSAEFSLRPMLASLDEVALQDARFVYEPKYDGMRCLADVQAGSGTIRLWSRLGKDKTSQFPELVRAFRHLARKLKASVVLDGEIVAVNEDGQPVGFQHLQGRIHLTGVTDAAPSGHTTPVAFIAFDILSDNGQDLTSLPFSARRARLERVLANSGQERLRSSEVVPADARSLYRRAEAHGWEGLIAKRADSTYKVGKRTSEWRKIKLVQRQEFVIGGWTEPRNSRSHFGALLLGVYEHGRLRYVGHAGTGFSERELARLHRLLQALETPECPFAARPTPNEPPHWVRPALVADVRFTEWTNDGRLRHPTYVGLRDDRDPRTVRREPIKRPPRIEAYDDERRSEQQSPGPADRPAELALPRSLRLLLHAVEELEHGSHGGLLALPDGHSLAVSHLNKVLWPKAGITKGELFRYYMQISPWLLPILKDRPLVMKRFPNGVTGHAFYQQRAPDVVPAGVRVEIIPEDEDVPFRLVGGGLTTLLYMTQLAVISQDPWFSRVGSPDLVDYVALDLDPMPGVPFQQVIDVALHCRDVLQALQVPHSLKTSGASGLHLYIPMPAKTRYQSGRLFCEILATLVAARAPKLATLTRSVDRRGRMVYLDYLQNVHGKTLASVYSVRATEFAGVSTPLRWSELEQGIRPHDVTLRTAIQRFAETGDLWADFRQLRPANLEHVLVQLEKR